MAKDNFMFGVSYCPYAKSGDVAMEYWDGDFKTMKELNFNTVRCFVAWDRIETKEGCCDYTKLDYIFELADKHDMQMILNIGGVFDGFGGIYPPRWLLKNYDCQIVITNPKLQETPFGTLMKICLDDPIYRKKAEEFTIRTIKRFSPSKKLIGWNIWNENYLKEPCFCKHSLAAYREWLTKKYDHNLEKLNEIWGTEFPIGFESWDEVQPAMGAGFTGGGHAARLDWLRFNEDKIAQLDANMVSLIKRFDPKKRPTTSNIVYTAPNDAYRHGCVDIWKINAEVDIGGYSFYTFMAEPYETASNISRIRSTSRAAGKAVWVLETEAGQVFHSEIYKKWGWDEIPKRKVSHWQAVAHGAKMILLWKYGRRVTDTQTEHFNLMAWDGSVTERALANAEVSKTLQDNAALVNDKFYVADVAILASSESMTFHQVNGSGDGWRDAWLGAYKLLWDAHIPVNYLTNEGILDGALANYKVLFLPCAMNFNEKIARKIEEFVKKGGCVIADAQFAVMDENSRINFQAPGFGLDKVFGGYINDLLCISATEELMYPDDTLNYRPVKLWHDDQRAEITTYKGTAIIAKYRSGKAAIVKNKHGNGTTWWYAGNVFRNYKNHDEKSIVPLVIDALEAVGVASKYAVIPLMPGEVVENVEISDLRNKKGEKLIFLNNFNNRELKFKLAFKEKMAANELTDIISGRKIKVSGGRCEISLDPCGTLILTVAKHAEHKKKNAVRLT